MRYSLSTLVLWSGIAPPILVATMSVALATLASAWELIDSPGRFPLPMLLLYFFEYGLGVSIPAAALLFVIAYQAGRGEEPKLQSTPLDFVALSVASLAVSFGLALMVVAAVSSF